MPIETRSISIAASPDTVFRYVADARNLPDWAPAFAGAVRPDGDAWIVTRDGADFPIVVRASAEHGTVDVVSATDERRGAFTRVLPDGDGAAYQLTLLFPEGTDEAAVAAQMATVALRDERSSMR